MYRHWGQGGQKQWLTPAGRRVRTEALFQSPLAVVCGYVRTAFESRIIFQGRFPLNHIGVGVGKGSSALIYV